MFDPPLLCSFRCTDSSYPPPCPCPLPPQTKIAPYSLCNLALYLKAVWTIS